jgi:hypothetical protein
MLNSMQDTGRLAAECGVVYAARSSYALANDASPFACLRTSAVIAP